MPPHELPLEGVKVSLMLTSRRFVIWRVSVVSPVMRRRVASEPRASGTTLANYSGCSPRNLGFVLKSPIGMPGHQITSDGNQNDSKTFERAIS